MRGKRTPTAHQRALRLLAIVDCLKTVGTELIDLDATDTIWRLEMMVGDIEREAATALLESHRTLTENL